MQLRFSLLILAVVFPVFFLPVDLQASQHLCHREQARQSPRRNRRRSRVRWPRPEAAIEAKSTTRHAACSLRICRCTPAMRGHSSTAATATTRQGKTQAAENFYRKAIVADPKQFEARLALGLLLAQQGVQEAQTQIEMAATLEPNPPSPAAKAQAYRALARLVRESDPDTAKQALLNALEAFPGDRKRYPAHGRNCRGGRR